MSRIKNKKLNGRIKNPRICENKKIKKVLYFRWILLLLLISIIIVKTNLTKKIHMGNILPFKVKEIEIEGTQYSKKETIEKHIGIKKESSILNLNLDMIALNLYEHPWIKNVKIQRHLPNKIHIIIEEHTPKIFVSLGDVYVANKEGHIFKRASSQYPLDLPLLTGLTKKIISEKSIDHKNIIKKAISLIHFKKLNILGRIDEVHWDKSLGFNVILQHPLEDLPMRVHLGFNPLANVKIAQIAIKKLRKLNRIPEIIWADISTFPNQIQIKERKDESI